MAQEKNDMEIKYWGVRGSVPAPLTKDDVLKKEAMLLRKVIENGGTERLFPNGEGIEEFLRELPLSVSGTYGGNTTCIEVRAKGSPLIMIDSGTGARALGNALFGRIFGANNLNPLSEDDATKNDLHLFLTHYHWDHLQGFPFFGPAFVNIPEKTLNIHFYGKRDARESLTDVLVHQQQYPNFPVVWQDMPCGKDYHELSRMDKRAITLGGATVRYQELTHPDSVFSYRVDVNGKSFVCATDTEHKDCPDPRLIALASGADVMYYDGQYTPEQYCDPKLPKFDWGHSTYEWGVRNAIAANVGTLVLGHHDPMTSDEGIEKIMERAIDFKEQQLKLPENNGKKLEVRVAYEGMEQAL